METFTGFIDAKDPYTNGHSLRVAEYSKEIATRMKLSNDYIENLYYIALLHDCGKIGVPDNILNKPAKLTDEEYKQIKEHTTIGYSILKNFTAIPNLKEGAHYHHERYDGKGYPEGISGESIPLCARIICVADSYDAMSSTRSYRKHLSEEETIHELEINNGKQFDPKIIPVIISMITDGFTKKIQNKVPYLNK